MSILIKNAKIIHPESEHNGRNKDILIRNGKIADISDNISDKKATTIESPNLHISSGWLDIGSSCGEPGFEHRETFDSLSASAAAGGFTAVAVFPNTQPVADSKSAIQFIINSTKNHLVDYHPIAAVSKLCQGEEITEMIDMYRNGAVAFSDGNKTIASSGLMLRALQYSRVVDGIVIHTPSDSSIANGNDIHEGEVSTSLGLKASPSLSEVLFVERDLRLAQYAEALLLLHNISSSDSIKRFNDLKEKNTFVSVAYLNLCKTDASIAAFDVNSKVSPPLRSEEDRAELLDAVNKGIVDVISSNHVPLEEELKKKEFVYAEPGAIGLQTCFSGLCSFADKLKMKKMIECLAYNPRKILGLPVPALAVGETANLCLFDPGQEWTLDDKTNQSLSKNSPFWNQRLKGKVIGVIKGRQNHFNNY